MATSASVHTNTYGGRTITLTVEEISTSIENNTSTVKWTLTSGTSSTYHSVYDITAWVGGTADTNKVYGPKTADWSSRAFPCKDGSTSGTLPIQHNADGTASPLTFRLRGSVYNNNPQNYDGSITLTTIPRASSFTISKTSGGAAATSWNLGEELWVNISRASNTFTHKVYYVINNSGNLVISNSATDSAHVTLASSLAQYIPSASATATIYVDTYSGTTKIGSASKTFTINVPSDVLPSISSVTKTDTAGYLSTYGAYVQGKSNLRIQTSASGNYSSITNYTVQLKNSGGIILNTKTGNDVTFSNISYTGTITVLVTVTDSRNRQDTDTSPISVATYENPKITTFTAERLNNNATVTLTYNASITNINNRNVNSKTFRIYKRQKGTSSWGSAIATYTSGYTYNGSTTTSCDENYGWEFKLEAQDSFTTTTKTDDVGTAFELMNWKADGTAMAIGKVSETSNTFEVALNTQLGGTLSVTGNTTVSGSVTANDYSGKIWGRTNDLATNNTNDTWIPVMVSGKWQHRVLPTTYNSTAPTLTGLTLNGDSGTNNVVKSGVIENQTSFESDTFKKQSFAGSTNVSGTWYNIINVRHRNGGGDGNSYGMQIRKLLTSNGPLEIRNQLSSTTWTGWQRVLVEFVLYDNATGTNGNVTLSETADHFTYIEIFFRVTNADGSYNSQKIYLPNGKSTTLSIVHNYYQSNIAYSYLFSKRISISGTTITSVRNDYTQFRGTAINEHSTANNVYIVRVVGYR